MINSEIKGIINNTIYLYLVQGLNYLLPILVLPYLIKTLSIDSFGIYSFAFAFSQFILLLVDFGFNISVTKKIAENSTNKIFVKNIFWIIIKIKLFLSLISFLITLLLIVGVGKINYYSDAILWSFLMVLGTVFFPLWWFQGLNKMRQMSLINAASKVLSYPLIFLFVKSSTDYNSAIIIQSMSFLLASIFSFIYIWKTHSFYFVRNNIFTSKQAYFDEIKDSFGIFLSNSSINLYTNSVTIFLGFFSTNYNVGLFGMMEKIVRVVCFGFMGPINQACFPVIVKIKKTNFLKAKRLFRIVVIVVFIIMILVYLLFYLFQRWILTTFLNGYNGIEFLLSIFMLMIFPISLGGIVGQLGLLALGGDYEKKIFSKIYIYVGLVSVPITIFLIYLLEIEGAIYAMLLVETFIFLIFWLFSKKQKII